VDSELILKALLPVTVLVEARYNADFKDSFSNQNLTVRQQLLGYLARCCL